jgi:hypothetical protein
MEHLASFTDYGAVESPRGSLRDQHVNIDRTAYARMQTIGITAGMVAEALNAPDSVRHLPQSDVSSYFCRFDGRTLRVTATLQECVLSASWTTNRPASR